MIPLKLKLLRVLHTHGQKYFFECMESGLFDRWRRRHVSLSLSLFLPPSPSRYPMMVVVVMVCWWFAGGGGGGGAMQARGWGNPA